MTELAIGAESTTPPSGADAGRRDNPCSRNPVALASIGLLIGMAGAAGATRVLSSRLFGVTPFDAPTFGVAAVTLLGVAAGAALLPATSAAKTSPVDALRGE